MYKTCKFCRDHDKTLRRDIRKRRRDISQSATHSDIFDCAACGSSRTKEFCPKCQKKNEKAASDKRDAYNQLIFEKIQEIGTCCEMCRKTFLKPQDGKYGFITVDSMEGITLDMIEIRNLEFDHLTKEEQLERFGEFRGNKINGVCQFGSYPTQKLESLKCQLVCLLCHVIATRRRSGRGNASGYTRPNASEKQAYVDATKLAINQCQLCMTFNTSELSYYEFDHVNPDNKTKTISQIVNNGDPLENLVIEMSNTRLLCRFCHRMHTANQSRNTHAARKTKVASDFRILIAHKKLKSIE